MDAVRKRYGKPTQATTQKVDGYDSAQWVYEEAEAPTGMDQDDRRVRHPHPDGLVPQIVRSLLLHPKPGMFNRQLVVQGWGPPTATGEQSGSPAYLYEDGLFVVVRRGGVGGEDDALRAEAEASAARIRSPSAPARRPPLRRPHPLRRADQTPDGNAEPRGAVVCLVHDLVGGLLQLEHGQGPRERRRRRRKERRAAAAARYPVVN